MSSLIPWRRNKGEGNGGALTLAEDFPLLFGRMRDEFDRLFDRFSFGLPSVFQDVNGWRWGMNVEDKPDALVVNAEAPGFEVGDFDLNITDDQLTLRASRKVETKDKEGKVTESREQECYQSISLPCGVDKEKVDAKYHNGILTVTLPKTAAGKGKKIAVKNG